MITNSLSLIFIISILGSEFKAGDCQILNGLDLQPRDFNYHVSIIINATRICAGGIVDENHVITAAHCVVPFEEHELLIVAGVKYLHDPERVLRLVKRISTPILYYCEQGKRNDVAVLRLWTPFVLGENIGVIAFPTAPVSIDDLTICSLAGVERSGTGSGMDKAKLSWLQLMIIPNTVCECMLGREVHPSLFCGTVIMENDVTHGDSGAILVCDGVAVGILKGGKNYAYYFGRIHDFESFIRKEIASP